MGKAVCICVCIVCFTMESFSARAGIFRTEGNFFASCSDSTPLTHGARVIVFNDKTGDGRSADDETLCGGQFFCIPEESWVSFQEYFVSDSTVMISPEFRVWLWDDPPTFYLCLLPWQDEAIEWISPTFIPPVTHPDSVAPIIEIPSNEWTCDSVRFELPMCQTEPTDLYFVYPDHWFEPHCARVCPGYGGWMILVNEATPFNGYRVPIIRLTPGCGGLPVAHPRVAPAGETVFMTFNWWGLEIVSPDYGFAMVEYLDQPPCATIDTMFAIRDGQGVYLNWTTYSETGLDSFELWKGISYNPRTAILVDVVPASDAPQGAEYEYYDVGPVGPQPQTYILSLVATDSIRYTAFRAYIPVDSTSDIDTALEVPAHVRIVANYPNPFNATTQIEFELPVTNAVTLQVFDINGRLVTTLADDRFIAGSHTIAFDGSNFASGLYFARLSAGDFQMTHKMVLLK